MSLFSSLNFALLFVYISYVTFCLNDMSQNVFKDVQILKDKLLTLDWSQNQNKLAIAHLLDSFKGFDCNGFFSLGRPLLTSVTSNFVTYLIILIQFKIYEQ